MTVPPTRLMPSVENKEVPEPIERCKHGAPISGSCYDCDEEKHHLEYMAEEKNKFRHLILDHKGTLRRYGVPTKYQECSFLTYQGNDKAVNECRKYQDGGIVLFGNTGCGKTHLAVSIMRHHFVNNLQTLIDKEWKNGYAYQYEQQCFITVPDLLLEIRSSFRSGAETTEEAVIEKYSTIPFLVLDDLGSEKTSEFAITTLYIIIDRRYRDELSTVITTNLTLQEIEEKLSARIASRLSGWINIKINMPDYRKRR